MGAEHVDARTVPFVRLRVLDWLCALSLSKRELCPSTGSGHMVRRARGHPMIREAQGAGLVMRAEPVEARTVPFDKLRAHDSAGSRHPLIRAAQGAGLVMRAEPVEARTVPFHTARDKDDAH